MRLEVAMHTLLKECLAFAELVFFSFYGFEPKIILKLFLSVKGVASCKNQMRICKSPLLSYILQSKSKEQLNNTHSATANLQAVLSLEYTKILRLYEA